MAVFYGSDEPTVELEVGEYQEFPPAEQKTPATEKSSKPDVFILLLLFGLLFVLQAVLNVTLRLVQSPTAGQGVSQQQNCPQGWVEFRASCYFFSEQRENWYNSRKECQRKEADLVVIDDLQEQAFLTAFRVQAWVGMTDSKQEGTWVWVDGTRVDDNRIQWALGQPDNANGGEDCGEVRIMSNFIGVNDYICIMSMQYICERKLSRTT